jgi:hypothetical protein
VRVSGDKRSGKVSREGQKKQPRRLSTFPQVERRREEAGEDGGVSREHAMTQHGGPHGSPAQPHPPRTFTLSFAPSPPRLAPGLVWVMPLVVVLTAEKR